MSDMQGGGAAFQGTMAVGNGYVQAAALRNQADYEKKIAELNNKTLDYQAGMADEASTDALKRGNTAANARSEMERQQAGTVRAQAAAAGGAGAAGGDAAATALEQVGDVSATDQAAIKTNAYREAFGFQSNALALRGQEQANTIQARMKANQLDYMARSSMITGWTKAIGYGFSAASDYNKNKSPTIDNQEP